MSFDGSGYYEIAKDLINTAQNSPNQEAMLRCAISRAYYAAFLKARNFLRDIEKDARIPKGAGAHEYVITQFRIHSDQTRREIGVALNILRDARNAADYDDTYPNLLNNATFMVIRAGAAITDLANL